MSRLTIFAKGNLDVRDSLHLLKIGEAVAWNGINQVLREMAPGTTARVRHETWTHSGVLLASPGTTPAKLEANAPDLGSQSLASQFSTAVFDVPADAVILSIQPDVYVRPLKHRSDNYSFFPGDLATWSPEGLAWLRQNFEPEPLSDAGQSMTNFMAIIERIRQGRDVPILIYNLSSFVPGETLHSYLGLDETSSTRIRRFNLALVELSAQTGVSIVDVDRVVAQGGAHQMKLDTTHLTATGCEAVCREVVRILQDYGVT